MTRGFQGEVQRRLCRVGIMAALLLSIPAGGAVAACHSESPQDILDCLQSAYADRDSAQYAELLSDDFELYNWGLDSTRWSLTVAREAAAQLYRGTASLRLDLLDGWRLHPGAEQDTWLLDSLSARVTLIPSSGEVDEPIEMLSEGNQLYLRRVSGDPPRIVIYRWVRLRPPPANLKEGQ